MGKKRTIKRFQRTFAVLGLLVVLSSIFTVPVSAVQYTGKVIFRNFGYNFVSSQNPALISGELGPLPVVNQGLTYWRILNNGLRVSPQVQTQPEELFSSVVDIYFSFYPYITTSVENDGLYYTGNPYSASAWKGNYLNSEGVWGSLNSVDVSSFVPVTDNVNRNGVSLRASYVGSEGLPISQLTLGTAVLNGTTFEPGHLGWGVRTSIIDPIPVYYYITSLRIITTESTADSEAIASVATQIGAMSDLLNAKLGDIAEIVQLIYEKTADIEQTLDICKGYFESMLDTLDSIDGTVIDIYALLDTQLAMLISSINTANNDITDAIEQQTEDMKEYFDNVFGSAVNDDLTGETDNIQSGMDNVDNAEQGYISTATDRFDGIVGSFTGFNGSVASGVSLVSTLFERVWSSFGEYIIVYSFPLSLGLVLLLIGRISRASARASRGSSKDKGGGTE